MNDNLIRKLQSLNEGINEEAKMFELMSHSPGHCSKIVCESCGATRLTCRCMQEKKSIPYGLCEACKKKNGQ